MARTSQPPAWLADVRLRALRRVAWLRECWSRGGYGDESAMAISHSEVDRALAPPAALAGEEQAFYRRDPIARPLSAALDSLADRQADGEPWRHLVTCLHLTAPEANLLALALAAEAIPALRRVYGYLQDETGGSDATLAWPPACGPGPTAPASAGRGVAALEPGPARAPRQLARIGSVRVAGRSGRARLSAPGPGGRPGPGERRWRAAAETAGRRAGAGGGAAVRPGDLPHRDAGRRGRRRSDAGRGRDHRPGRRRTTVLAAQAAAAVGLPLLALDAEILVGGDVLAAATGLARAARLSDAAVIWRDADALDPAVLAAVSGLAPVAFLTTGTQQQARRAGAWSAGRSRCRRWTEHPGCGCRRRSAVPARRRSPSPSGRCAQPRSPPWHEPPRRAAPRPGRSPGRCCCRPGRSRSPACRCPTTGPTWSCPLRWAST